jgi:hypothetical protein
MDNKWGKREKKKTNLVKKQQKVISDSCQACATVKLDENIKCGKQIKHETH